MWRKNDATKDELKGVVERLRTERPEADPLTLDHVKTTAMARARAAAGSRGAGLKRWTVAGVTVGVMAAGAGGVIAGGTSGQGPGGSAAVAQYGNNCDNGNITGSGNGNGTGGGSGNENGNGSNDDNCNENSFNTTTNNNSSTNNTNNYTTVNNYYPVDAEGKGGVKGTKTTKGVDRRLKVHVHVPRGSKLKKVVVRIDGKIVKTLNGKKATDRIALYNVPCGNTKVAVVVTLANGKTVTARHTYKLCTAS